MGCIVLSSTGSKFHSVGPETAKLRRECERCFSDPQIQYNTYMYTDVVCVYDCMSVCMHICM